MNNMIKTKPFFVIAILALSVLVAACSSSAEKLNQDGNQAFAEQAYLDALEAYQTAQIESPELAEPYYNAANTYYRQGQYAQALEQLQQALQYANEESLAENSLFNLGNNFFSTQDLETAIEAYKGALLLNPQDQDAKYNLELALQQQQEQQQEQEQQEQSQDEQNQEENQDESQNGENQDEQEQEQSGDQSDNQDEGEQGEDQSENQDQGNEDQQQEDQNQNNGQPQEGENQDDEGSQPGQMPPPGQRMTEEQARQLLAALAEDMDTLQERLGEILFVRKPPPVQDW